MPDAPAQFLPHGLRVLIACDPARPELGAYVVNADMGSLNREGWHFGHLLIPNATDESSERPAQIDLRPDPADKRTAGASKRAAATAVRTEFRAVKKAGQTDEPLRKSVARDGLGNSLAVANAPNLDLPSADRGETAAAPSPRRGNRPAKAEPAVDLDELARREAAAKHAL